MSHRLIYWRSLWVIIVMTIMASCSTSRKTMQNVMIGDISGTEYMERVISRSTSRECITAKTRIRLNSGENSSMTVNANMRIRRGEVIRFSVAPFLGIEVARIEITPKYILAVDRVNKRYVQADFSELSTLLNTELDFNVIQSLLMNELFLPGKDKLALSDMGEFSIENVGNQFRIDVKSSKRIGYTFLTSRTDGSLEETSISMKKTPYSLCCRYNEFMRLDNYNYPQSIDISVLGMKKSYSVNMELSRIGTDTNWDSKTELPSKYKKMSLYDLLKILFKL